MKSYAVLHASVGLTEDALDGQVELQTPDLILEEKEGAERARARYDRLLERTEKDALVTLLLEADEEDEGDEDDGDETAPLLPGEEPRS